MRNTHISEEDKIAFDIYLYDQIINGKFIGYHKDLSKFKIKPGDTVLIRKGTVYHSMSDGKLHTAKKTYEVVVDHFLHGSQYIHDNRKIIINSEVTWAGSGGYWHRADINDVVKAGVV